MSRSIDSISTINFTSCELVLEEGGKFECHVSVAPDFDGSLVIDIYDLDNPVHPEGHFGWWQFSVEKSTSTISGTVTVLDGMVQCVLVGQDPINFWVNTDYKNTDRLIVNAVLRKNITNAIVYLDKIPAFKDAAAASDYRAAFNRNWAVPKFAVATCVFSKSSTVRIVSRNIFTRDAVGNLCLDIYRMLRQNNIAVELYCYNTDLALNDFVRRADRLAIDANASDQLLYFHSIYDPDLEKILYIPFKRRIAYFHGVTKPELLQVFDPELSVACLKGILQIKHLEQFDVLAANSRASATMLVSKFSDDPVVDVDDVLIIPPKLLAANTLFAEIPSCKKPTTTKMLYVGRIKSNKKIEHLLALFSEYQKLDANAELCLVGSGSDKAYWDYLMWTQQKQLTLSLDAVHWVGSVTDEELRTYYASSTVYVSMSEDEGFCLPILEAMLAGVPVFAYGLPAIREVMQDTGVFFMEKDFNYLAERLYALLKDSANVQQVISKQALRADQLANQMDGRGFLKLLAMV